MHRSFNIDEYLTEQHWQPVFLFSKPSVSIHVVHTSNCHGQNCTRRAIYRLGIDTLIANILVLGLKGHGHESQEHCRRGTAHTCEWWLLLVYSMLSYLLMLVSMLVSKHKRRRYFNDVTATKQMLVPRWCCATSRPPTGLRSGAAWWIR